MDRYLLLVEPKQFILFKVLCMCVLVHMSHHQTSCWSWSTENSSLCKAGNMRWGAVRRNLLNASICSIDNSLKVPDLAIITSITVTSPFMKKLFLCVRFNSFRNAFIMAWFNRCISRMPFRPGRSDKFNNNNDQQLITRTNRKNSGKKLTWRYQDIGRE